LKFVHSNEELVRLTTEIGAARRELSSAEQVKSQLASVNERLLNTQADRDSLKVLIDAERQHAN